MSGDELAIFTSLAGTGIGGMLAGVCAPRGWRANVCYAVGGPLLIAAALYGMEPLQFDTGFLWKMATALTPLAAVLLVLLIAAPRRAEKPMHKSIAPAPLIEKREDDKKEEPPRVFVDKSATVEALTGKFTGRTDVEGAQLVKPYLAKWMKVRGRFENLRKYNDEYTLCLERPYISSAVYINLNKSQNDAAEICQFGQEVAVVGLIGSIDRHSIWLAKAEFIPLADAADAVYVSPPPKPKKVRSARSRPPASAP